MITQEEGFSRLVVECAAGKEELFIIGKPTAGILEIGITFANKQREYILVDDPDLDKIIDELVQYRANYMLLGR